MDDLLPPNLPPVQSHRLVAVEPLCIDGLTIPSISTNIHCSTTNKPHCTHCQLPTRPIALKRLTGAAETRHLARREVAASLSLPAHPFLISAYTYQLSQTTPNHLDLILPAAQCDMLSVLDVSLPATPSVLSLCHSVAQALAFLHSYNWLHRDVKWDNVLLFADTPDKQGVVSLDAAGGTVRPVLADLGLARYMGDDDAFVPSAPVEASHIVRARRMSICGTESHQAPEMALGDEYGPPVDVFALCLCLVQALAGVESINSRSPYDADVPWPAVHDHLTSASLAQPIDTLAEALQASLSTTPHERPSAAELSATLLPFL